MIKVTIQEKDFKVCEKWKDVSFGQYIDILNIEKDNWDSLEKSIKLISALSDQPKEIEEALYEMDIDELNNLSQYMTWINTDFKTEAETSEAKTSFEIDGKKYSINKDFKRLSIGAMISVEEALKNDNLNPQEIALAVLLRPIDENGREEKFDSDFFFHVIDELKYKINLIEVYQHISFFLSTEKPSTKSISKGFSVVKI